jgi:hypothetical protein
MSHSTFDRSHNYIDAAAPSTLAKIQAEKITSLPIVMSVLFTELDINGDGYSED